MRFCLGFPVGVVWDCACAALGVEEVEIDGICASKVEGGGYGWGGIYVSWVCHNASGAYLYAGAVPEPGSEVFRLDVCCSFPVCVLLHRVDGSGHCNLSSEYKMVLRIPEESVSRPGGMV